MCNSTIKHMANFRVIAYNTFLKPMLMIGRLYQVKLTTYFLAVNFERL